MNLPSGAQYKLTCQVERKKLTKISFNTAFSHRLGFVAMRHSSKELYMPLPHESELSERLSQLLKYLDADFYNRLESICVNAALPLAELKDADTTPSVALYTQHAHRLIHQIEQYLRLRRVGLKPYIHELIEMEEEGHDCRECSTPCEIRHSAQITGIKEAHSKIWEMLVCLHNCDVPLADDAVEQESLRKLSAEIKKLDATLTELISLEESSLLPLILEAQKAIHVRN
jgi:hypothetical protein